MLYSTRQQRKPQRKAPCKSKQAKQTKAQTIKELQRKVIELQAQSIFNQSKAHNALESFGHSKLMGRIGYSGQFMGRDKRGNPIVRMGKFSKSNAIRNRLQRTLAV